MGKLDGVYSVVDSGLTTVSAKVTPGDYPSVDPSPLPFNNSCRSRGSLGLPGAATS